MLWWLQIAGQKYVAMEKTSLSEQLQGLNLKKFPANIAMGYIGRKDEKRFLYS